MALNWFNTNQYQTTHGVKIAAYGAAGSGKTWLIKTLDSPFVISVESGMMTLRKDNFHGLIVNTLDDFKDAYQWATQSQEARQFGSLALDSVSELAEKILEQKLSTNRDGRKAYGEMQQELTPWIKGFRDIVGRNVLFTFKEEYVKDEFTGQMFWAPSMPGKQLIKDVPYWFDQVVRTMVHLQPNQDGSFTKIHYLQCQKTGADCAKDRSGALNQQEPADLRQLFQKIAAS
jgi:hypothetical protein